MVEIAGFNIPTAPITDTVSLTIWLGFYLFIFTIIAAILFFFIYYATRAHTLIVRNNDRVIEARYMVFEKRDKKTGVTWLGTGFWSRKLRIPLPPPGYASITRKGKMWIEAIRMSEDEFFYASPPEIGKETMIGLKNNLVSFKTGPDTYFFLRDEGKDDPMLQEALKTYNFLTPVEREVILYQYEKSDAKKKKGFMSPEFIMPMTSLTIVFMIIIFGIMYIDQIFAPANQMADRVIEMQEVQIEMQKSLIRFVQAFGQVTGGGNFAQVFPTDGSGSGDPLIIGNEAGKHPDG